MVGLAVCFRYKLVAHYRLPDNRYSLDVYTERMYFGFPGSSLDRPARVVLCNGWTGSVVNASRLEMLQLVSGLMIV